MTFLALHHMREGPAREQCGGMVAASGWVHGVLPAPVTAGPGGGDVPDPDARDGRVVEAESWAAGAAGDPAGGLDMDEVCRVLDVPLRIPRAVPPLYAAGVFAALRWLLGMDDTPPLPLPWRTPDGQPATAPYIYTRLLAAAGPIDASRQMALRAEATRLAAQSRRLARLVVAAAASG